MKHIVCLGLFLFGVTACTWVDLNEAGEHVQLAEAAASECNFVGMVSAQTKAKVVLDRNRAKVEEELLILARNEAAKLGANTVVSEGPPAQGSQSFKAFVCQ